MEIFQCMVSDERDHWLGLVDRESGYLFWYNLRDGNSAWMTDEDQVAYKAGFRAVEDYDYGHYDPCAPMQEGRSNTRRLNQANAFASSAADIAASYIEATTDFESKLQDAKKRGHDKLQDKLAKKRTKKDSASK